MGILSIWIHMAETCTTPFDDSDSPFDVDLVADLDRNIWAASASLNTELLDDNYQNKRTSSSENVSYK